MAWKTKHFEFCVSICFYKVTIKSDRLCYLHKQQKITSLLRDQIYTSKIKKKSKKKETVSKNVLKSINYNGTHLQHIKLHRRLRKDIKRLWSIDLTLEIRSYFIRKKQKIIHTLWTYSQLISMHKCRIFKKVCIQYAY